MEEQDLLSTSLRGDSLTRGLKGQGPKKPTSKKTTGKGRPTPAPVPPPTPAPVPPPTEAPVIPTDAPVLAPVVAPFAPIVPTVPTA